MRIIGENRVAAESKLAALNDVIEARHTNRRRFTEEPVPEAMLETLEAAASAEEACLVVVRNPEQRVAVASLSQHADNIENLNPAYRAELRAWTSDDPQRREGVLALAVPHVTGDSHDEVPIRDFDARGSGGLPPATHSSRDQFLVLLATPGDGQPDWLRAGEALERVLLEITRQGFMASPLTQVTEVPAFVMLREQAQIWRTLDDLEAALDSVAPAASQLCHQLLVQLQHHNLEGGAHPLPGGRAHAARAGRRAARGLPRVGPRAGRVGVRQRA